MTKKASNKKTDKKDSPDIPDETPELIDPISFDELKTIYNDNFPKLWESYSAALAVMGQHFIDDISNPFTLFFQGPPSGGKTTVLDCFMGLNDYIYWSDSFTAASFVSHSTTTPKNQLKDIDMLPKIRHKTLITPELSTLFQDRKDSLNQTMGILTRVLDGNGLMRDTGAHGSRGYQGDYFFTWLGATTPIQPHVWKLMGSIGARMYFLNVNTGDDSENEMLDQIMGNSHKKKVIMCQKATKAFFIGMGAKHPEKVHWNRENENREIMKVIVKLAKLLARLRGTVDIKKTKNDETGESDFAFTQPIIEKPSRATSMLYNLARGNAIINGRKFLKFEDLPIVIEIALSSAPFDRTGVFNALLERGILTSEETADILNCSIPIARNIIKRLSVLGMVDVEDKIEGFGGRATKVISLTYDLMWFRGKDFQAMRKGIYE